MSFLNKLFGDPNAREVKRLRAIVDRVNALESGIQALSDVALKERIAAIKEQVQGGISLDHVLEEVFALVREASRRATGKRHYDVQLIGGVALHRGSIAEMRTGEGKTLVATAPVALNALTGKGVHVVTVNDYLARRDAVWMGQVYHALGLSVGSIQHGASFLYDPEFKAEPSHDPERDETGSFHVDMDYLRPVSRREAYAADITYGTNNEFGFDYLRDNMAPSLAQKVQRGLNYAVVDEVDSILIDEARTPLIISAPAQEPEQLYYRFAELVTRLIEKEDYQVDEKLRAASITEAGITKMEQWLGVENLYGQGVRLVHHLEQALRAHAMYRRDRDYVVKDGEVIIVDEFTGRLMQGRRYSEGLHQAIEAKEHVSIQRESVTLATITFQNYFRLYGKLAGMTGTAATEAEEFYKIYKLDVLSIPTNKDSRRKDLPDLLYRNEIGKFKAVAAEIKRRHALGQPVLVGTASIAKNEVLSELLKQNGIPHEMLNAKNHEREGEIIAQAGRRGGVTVATNMAGRGVDIILGGNPPDKDEAEAVRALGGLHVIGTERHESRRIDNQLRGRAGRQGDAGTTQFYVSTEDDLMRIFSSDRMKKVMEVTKLPEEEAIQNIVLTKAIESAQRKVEGHNFDIRKHVLEYDDVLNKHRTAIYKKRNDILEAADKATVEGVRPLTSFVMDMFEGEVEQLVAACTTADDLSAWEVDRLRDATRLILPQAIEAVLPTLDPKLVEGEGHAQARTKLIEAIMEAVKLAYKAFEEQVGDEVALAEIEKIVLLRSMDDLWIEHLENMDYLRRGVNLQAYGQRDPLVEYKKEAYQRFQELQNLIQQRVTHTIFKVKFVRDMAEADANKVDALAPSAEMSGGEAALQQFASQEPTAAQKKDVGRNDACPCGSGKKFKKCHGA
ncbi:preprotein translocase subunit SecA [Patescibacteria group bacterium]|nr:preprotein translocase subunit SecA [Patescibacteria group bacterium]